MAELVYAIACSKVILDQNGIPSAMEFLDEIGISPVDGRLPPPKTIPREITLLLQFTRSDHTKPESQAACKLSYNGPINNKLMSDQEFEIDLVSAASTRIIVTVPDLPIPDGSGVYSFAVKLKQPNGRWKLVSRYPFVIKLEGFQQSDTNPSKQSKKKESVAKKKKTKKKGTKTRVAKKKSGTR